MNKVTKILSALVLVILVWGYFYISKNAEIEKIEEKNNLQEVTVAQWWQEKYLIYLPFYIAQERWFFKDEWLNIKIKYSWNDDQVFATVLKWEAQFWIWDPVFTAISREKWAKWKVVASIVNWVALWWVSKKESNISKIQNINDIKNLRIWTFPKPSTAHTLVKNTIEENNTILSNTKIVEAGLASQLALLESDNADIAIQLEPWASIAEANWYNISFSFPEFYWDFSFTWLSTIESVIKNDPKLVQKMVNAIEKANVYAHTNLKWTIEVAQSLFPDLDKKIISNAVNRMIDANTIPKHAFSSVKWWNKAVEIRIQVWDLKSKESANLSLDNSFAIKARNNK